MKVLKPDTQEESSGAIVQVKELDKPLVPLKEAVEYWQEYKKFEQAILSPEDYVWFVEWTVGDKVQRKAFSTQEEANRFKERVPNGRIYRRKRKSAYRKLAAFYGFTLPVYEPGTLPDIESKLEQVGQFYVRYIKAPGVSGIIYMDEKLRVLKADYSVAVVT